MPDADDFRALARSSPWLWSTLRFTFGSGPSRQRVRARLRRPDLLRVETTDGALLQSLTTDGAAADAGLQPGDVITAVDGRTLGDGSLASIVRSFEPGQSVTVAYLRDGEERSADVVLGSSTS